MAITNKAILDKITKANKYIKTLKEQGLAKSIVAKKLNESVNRVSKGNKPRTYFPTVKAKGGKISAKQRKQLLKVYKEIQRTEKYLGTTPIAEIKQHPYATYATDDVSMRIRETLANKYNIDPNILSNEFFDFLNTDAVQKLFEDGNFGSTVMEIILQAVQKNPDMMMKYDEVSELVNDYVDSPANFMDSKLKELQNKKQKDAETELLIKRIKDYIASPHRDEYAIEVFEDVFEIFRKL